MKATQANLDSSVTAEEEVESVRSNDSRVHCRSRGNIFGLSIHVSGVNAEESGVVSLLDHDVSDWRSVVSREHQARRSDSLHLLS